jgi:hypothetical protein
MVSLRSTHPTRELVVIEKPKANRQRRKLPRVSKAKGGLMPGFDWNNLSAQVQEMDDLEYVERLKRGFEPTPPSPPRHGRRGGR